MIELIPTLRSYARYWARNQVDADDLVQDTLLRVFQYAANFQVGTNLRAWLFSILRNKFYSNTVKSMREPVGVEQYVASLPFDLPIEDLHR